MTYKLNSEISKFLSPIVLIFPNELHIEYESGYAAAETVFDKKYKIISIEAVGDKIEIILEELKAPSLNWCGEEAVSFF